MSFGDRLREIREDQGLNQGELADLVETSQSTISQLEQGSRNPSYQMLRRLAQALKVSVSYLLGEGEVEELSPDEEVHFRQYRALSDDARAQVQEYMRFLRMRRRDAPGGEHEGG